eukprot:jgi/Mesen1/3986/ME000210S03230
MQALGRFVQPACEVVRSSVLQHLRLSSGSLRSAQSVLPGTRRLFAENAAAGTFLDKQEVTDRVLTVVKNFQKVDPSKVTPTSNFQNDLGLDSLDTVEVVMAFEEEFALEIPDSEADKIVSTADAINYIAAHPQAK